MLLEGSILNGEIVLDESTVLPDGTRVRVETISATHAPVRKPIGSLRLLKARMASDAATNPGDTLAAALKPFIGCLEGLPEDAATDHDRYIRNGLPGSSGDSQ